MTHEEAVKLIDQQKQIPHPINPGGVRIIRNIIYYDDRNGRLWALIWLEGQMLLTYKEKKTNIFYLAE